MGTESLARLVDRGAGSAVEEDVMRDRYRGVLLGAAAGNALGVAVEGESQAAIRRRFPNGVTEVLSEERHRPWDDDLAHTALLAEALTRSEELSLDHLGLQLVQWAGQSGRGIGRLTREVISELERGTPASDAARIVWERVGWSTAGNGALARSSPVALRWRTGGTQMLRAARTSALVTHFDPRSLWSTVAFDVALALALSGGPPDADELAGAVEDVDETGWRADAVEQVCATIRASKSGGLDELELDDPMDMGYTLKGLRVGLWCMWQSGTLESVVTKVVSAGGDTDTNGTIVGAAMGALSGTAGIPKRWLAGVPQTEKLTALADELFESSRARGR